MRIGFLSGTFHPEPGGPPTYLYHLLPALQARGHTVELLTFGDPIDHDYGYPVTRIPRTGSRVQRVLTLTRQLVALARRSDAVFVMGYLQPLLFVRPFIRARVVAKVVSDATWEFADRNKLTDLDVTAYQTASLPTRLALLRWVYRRAARRMEAIIVPSDHVARLVGHWGVPAERVNIIHNAIPDTDLHTVPRADLRRELDLPSDRHLLVSVARLTPVKGVDVAIRAIPNLPACEFVIVGDGPQFDALHALAESLGVAERVHFVGRQAHDDVLRYMRAADTFVLSSHTEGLSHVLLEALAVGTPALATTVGGNPEILTDGVNGLLVPPGDPTAIVAAVERLRDDPALAESLVAGGRIRSADFSWDATVTATEKVICGNQALM